MLLPRFVCNIRTGLCSPPSKYNSKTISKLVYTSLYCCRISKDIWFFPECNVFLRKHIRKYSYFFYITFLTCASILKINLYKHIRTNNMLLRQAKIVEITPFLHSMCKNSIIYHFKNIYLKERNLDYLNGKHVH